jgi:hypothetical protein
MRRFGGILLVLALAMASKVRGGDEKKMGDLKALQGTWTIVSMERNGKPVPPERIENRVIVIVGKTFIDQTGNEILGERGMTSEQCGPSVFPPGVHAGTGNPYWSILPQNCDHRSLV